MKAMPSVTTDPIADFLTRIRNSLAAGQSEVVIPYSKLKAGLAKLLKAKGFIADFDLDKEGFKSLRLQLLSPEGASPITGLERVSKPGRRVYVSHGEIPLVMGGTGMAVISTSKGMMDGRSARKHGLGGELICKVW